MLSNRIDDMLIDGASFSLAACDLDQASSDLLESAATDGTVGGGPLTDSALEGQLADVKALCLVEQDVDSQVVTDCVDKYGTPWIGTIGTGPLSVSVLGNKLDDATSLKEDDEVDLCGPTTRNEVANEDGTGLLTASVLKNRRDDVKALYVASYGVDADSVDDLDEDGTHWTLDDGPLAVSALDADKEDVPEYAARVGTVWIGTVGSGPLTVSVLDHLDEQDIDSQDDADYVDKHGTPWIGTVGTGPSRCHT